MKKKIVYIAHPIGGDVEGNIDKILAIVRNINLTMPNVVAMAPYIVDCLAMDDSVPNERWIGIDKNHALIRSGIFDAIWLYGNRVSEGMKGEIILFKQLNIPVISKNEGTK